VTSLPTGTVAFLMTDIEGSTRLVSALGEAFPRVLDEHFALLDRAVTGEGGTPVSSEGDALFAVFPSARQAIGAALTAQRLIGDHAWPTGATVRVRMGIHVGEAVFGGRDYTGIDVHRTARITNAAWGGEILISEAARALAAEALPERASVRDLGEHALRDLPAPERLFQVCGPGLQSDFPPPRSLSQATRTNLPTPLTRFVGRRKELRDVAELLRGERLVTLIGPGGTGKTRLAIEAARAALSDFPGGVWFVALEAVREHALVIPTIAQAVGVPEQPGRAPIDVLAEGLADRRTLLVLDNLEQVVEAAPDLAQLLQAAPSATALASSRESLGIAGEQVYPVPVLGLPKEPGTPTAADIRDADAVLLFLERARAVRPGFALTDENAPAVAAICRRLDGLPLAIELAASRTNLLAPAQILARLEHRLTLLSSSQRDLPERQRTLRGAIDWSYELLSEPECAVFRRFSVFAGGADLDAALAVLDPDGSLGSDPLDLLAALVDRSLIRSDNDGDAARFEMLETIREYAAEKLVEAGESDATRTAHCDWFGRLAEGAQAVMLSDRRVAMLDRLDRELPNLRAAVAFAMERDDQSSALRILVPLLDFWRTRSHLTEARHGLDKVLDRGGAMPVADRARAQIVAAEMANWQTDYARSAELSAAALREAETGGDPRLLAQALSNAGWSKVHIDSAWAIERFEAATHLVDVTDDPGLVADIQQGIALSEFRLGHLDRAEEASRLAIAAGHRTGGDSTHGINSFTLGMIQLRRDRVGDAIDEFRDGLSRATDGGFEIGLGIALDCFAVVALRLGDPATAVAIGTFANELRRRLGGGPTVTLIGVESPVDGGRGELSAEAFDTAVARGSQMSIEEAVSIAREMKPGAAAAG
jgi:predicted ATPase/class 3 adenylate cyclase